MQHSKAKTITGWVLTVLVGLFLILGSGVPKFMDWPGKAEAMTHLGIPLGILPTIGVIEITVALLFLIPRTTFLGAVFTTGYLGGAVFTHLRAGDPAFNCVFPVILGAIMWTALGLRKPEVFALALGMRTVKTNVGAAS